MSRNMSKVAAVAVSCMVGGITAVNVQPTAKSASAADVISILAGIIPPKGQNAEHDKHGRNLHAGWHRGDRRGDDDSSGYWWPSTPSPASSSPEAGHHMWAPTTPTPASSSGVSPPTTRGPDAPPAPSRGWSPTAPSPVSPPTAGRMWAPTAPSPMPVYSTSTEMYNKFDGDDDDQAGNNARGITTTATTVTSSSMSTSTSSSAFACVPEVEACVADTEPGGCWDCLQEVSTCEAVGGACSDVVDYFCCTFGQACSKNAPLVNYVDCVMEDVGCTVDTDFCDTEDENTAPIAIGPEVCTAEYSACWEDDTCATCMDGEAMTGGVCNSSGTSCEEKTDHFCCVTATMDQCSDNSLFLEYTSCSMSMVACPFSDDVCSSGGGGDDDDANNAVCPVELSKCQADEECAACYNEAVVDGSCDPTITVDCRGYADYFCCSVAEECTRNDLLLGWLNCGLEIYLPEECTLTDLCDSDVGGSGDSSDSDESSSSDGGSGDDDGEDCPVELAECLADFECATCFEGATVDGSCDNSVPGCRGRADYYCCVAGESCSGNVLAVAYMNCLIDIEMDEPCTLTDACQYAGGYDDDGADDAGEENNPDTRGIDSSDDGDGEICLAEMADCQADETCAACLAGANLDGACDSSAAVNCAGAVNYYCCLAGDACSDHPVLLNWLNCGLKEFFPEESCMVADLCTVFATEAPPSLPLLPGTGTGFSDDDDDDEYSPTSSPTAAPSDYPGERGGRGGEGENNRCFVQETACVADATCEACMAGARLDGSCNRDAADCADVADFYCCVVDGEGQAGCSSNALLLDYVNCGIELESCTLTDLCDYSNGNGGEGDGDDDSAVGREIGGGPGDEGERAGEVVVTQAPTSFNPSGGLGRQVMTFSPTSSPTSAPADGGGGGGGGGGPNSCTIQQTACTSDDACASCMAGARLDGSCIADAVDCSGISSYFCCLIGDGDGEGCSSNALLLDFVNCGIELDSCTLTDLCDYTPVGDGDGDEEVRASATGGMTGSSGAAGSVSGSFGGSVLSAAATLIGLLSTTLGIMPL